MAAAVHRVTHPSTKHLAFLFLFFFYFCPSSSSNGDVLKTSSCSFPYSRFIFSPCYKQVDRRFITKAYKALHLGLHASNILQVIKIHYCSTPGAGLLRVIKSVTLKKPKEKPKQNTKSSFRKNLRMSYMITRPWYFTCAYYLHISFVKQHLIR